MGMFPVDFMRICSRGWGADKANPAKLSPAAGMGSLGVFLRITLVFIGIIPPAFPGKGQMTQAGEGSTEQTLVIPLSCPHLPKTLLSSPYKTPGVFSAPGAAGKGNFGLEKPGWGLWGEGFWVCRCSVGGQEGQTPN